MVQQKVHGLHHGHTGTERGYRPAQETHEPALEAGQID
jgi:hypothetical protein